MSLRELRFAPVLSLIVLIATGSSCGQQNPYRDDVARQNSLESLAKEKDLAAAVGTYCGSIFVGRNKRTYPATLVLLIGNNNIHSSTSQDPTDTVQQPVLVGNMRITEMASAGDAIYSQDTELATAMGNAGTISFASGDYDKTRRMLFLPYSVNVHPQGPYGQLSGVLGTADNPSEFTGEWDANANEPFGTFDFKPCPMDSSEGAS